MQHSKDNCKCFFAAKEIGGAMHSPLRLMKLNFLFDCFSDII
jgi:hypothetical protein